MINEPGAIWTETFGISGSDVVGWYFDGQTFNGFFSDGQTLTTIGPSNSVGLGIDGNNIVGYYDDANDYTHGFILDDQTNILTSFDFPGAMDTRLNGISGNNIVGSYDDTSNSYSFIYTTPEPSTIVLLLIAGLASLPIFLRKLKGR